MTGAWGSGRWVFLLSVKRNDAMRRKILLCVVSLWCAAGMGFGQADVWREASLALDSGDADRAIQLWDSLAKDQASAALWYNLGTAHLEKGERGWAILYLERALKWEPGYDQAWRQLAIAREGVIEPVIEVPDFFLQRWWEGMVGSLPGNGWALCFLLSFTTAVVALLLRYTGRGRGPLMAAVAVVAVSLTVLFALAAQYSYRQFYHSAEAISVERSVSLYVSPDTASPLLREFPWGTKLEVVSELEAWYEVVLPNKERGWVRMEAVERI